MFDRTGKGSWWDAALRVNSGCTKVSPGCDNCWAESELAIRSKSPNKKIAAQWPGNFFGDVHLLEDNLKKVLKAKKPKAWAVWNDLFHEGVPFWYIAKVFYTAAICYRHAMIILTKRPERAFEFLQWVKEKSKGNWWGEFGQLASHLPIDEHEEIGEPYLTYHKNAKKHYYPDIPEPVDKLGDAGIFVPWPVPNIWLGTSAEDQQRLEERIGDLLKCPASLLFLSLEPMLGKMDLGGIEGIEGKSGKIWRCTKCQWQGHYDLLTGGNLSINCPECNARNTLGSNHENELTVVEYEPGLGWVIVGAESRGGGIGRECRIEWVRKIVEQCKAAGVPVFVKQLHVEGKLVKDINKFPEDLRVREVPAFCVQ